jgi:hypothetical protein
MPHANSYQTQNKIDALAAMHPPGNTYKFVLYTSASTMTAATTTYSTTNEVVGTGYTAGGITLTGYTAGSSGTTAWITWNNVSIPNSTITARGASIVDTTKSGRIVALIDFGADITSTNDTWSYTFPTANASSAIVRLA